MSMGSGKRINRAAVDCKVRRSKSDIENQSKYEGVYANPQLMHAVTSLVGSVVRVQVRDGSLYEGILHTFSMQFDIVLEMAHKITKDVCDPELLNLGPVVCNLIASYPFEDGIVKKLILRPCDIVQISAKNVDTDYAVKDSFTDTAISRYNGQVVERELEPWECPMSESEDSLLSVDTDGSSANGWDANDMFRLNAEKYGVKSSYDTSMTEYTVALKQRDTEEWRVREARAARIAHEIEQNATYHNRSQIENGDEEDRYSAVVRPVEDSTKYIAPQKRGKSIPRQLSPVHVVKPPKESHNGESCLPPLPPPAPMPKPISTLPPRIERRRETERKQLMKQKGRTDEIEEFRKFSSNFKLTDENKDLSEMSMENKLEMAQNKLTEQPKTEKTLDEKPMVDISKSTLNPNAKEFVFNPNAKTFIPRVLPVSSPPVQPQRVQAASPVIAAPQLLTGIPPQQLFAANVMPQYVMQSFTQVAPRFRKAVPIAMQSRHEMNPSMHVAAATGQPILAPAGLQTPSQIYASSLPPQQHPNMRYPQMNFVVGPRVAQQVAVVPTSPASYCDGPHIPPHLIMSTNQGGQQPSPSPVHQPTAVYQQQYPAQSLVLMHQAPHHMHHPMHHVGQSSTPPYVQQQHS